MERELNVEVLRYYDEEEINSIEIFDACDKNLNKEDLTEKEKKIVELLFEGYNNIKKYRDS